MQRSMITTLEFYGMGLKSNMVIRLIIFLFLGIGRLLYIYPMQGMIRYLESMWLIDLLHNKNFMYLENGKIRFNI